MSKLGDFFPPSEKECHISRNLVPGCVIRIHCTFTLPPKIKFLVVAHVTKNPLLFVINSEISEFVQLRSYLLDCQILLPASEYEFLDHDSYLDCGQIIDSLSLTYIQEEIEKDIGIIKGNLKHCTISEILTVIEKSKMISPKHKNLIRSSL